MGVFLPAGLPKILLPPFPSVPHGIGTLEKFLLKTDSIGVPAMKSESTNIC